MTCLGGARLIKGSVARPITWWVNTYTIGDLKGVIIMEINDKDRINTNVVTIKEAPGIAKEALVRMGTILAIHIRLRASSDVTVFKRVRVP